MSKKELISELDALIEYESVRIRQTSIPADHRKDEYRDNIGKVMRYMGKRDAFYYVKHLLEH